MKESTHGAVSVAAKNRIRQLETALYKAGIECRKNNPQQALAIIKETGVFGVVALTQSGQEAAKQKENHG